MRETELIQYGFQPCVETRIKGGQFPLSWVSSIKKHRTSRRERVLLKSFNSSGCSGMGRCDETESASSEIVAKGQAGIIIGVALHNCPHKYHIALPASLKGVQVEDPQIAPVV